VSTTPEVETNVIGSVEGQIGAASEPSSGTAVASATGKSGRSNRMSLRGSRGSGAQRFEARKVKRLVRHIDPWSMLKLATLVWLSMWLTTMIAVVILWIVGRNSGAIGSIEEFVNSSLSLQDWKLDGSFLFRQFGLVTLLIALGLAVGATVATLVFNLISDIIGGVWVTVIEEETARPIAGS